MRTTSAVSTATSVPAPMAMPTSASASAGASLTPSPTIATVRPLPLQLLHLGRLAVRQDLREHLVDAELGGDAAGRRRRVAGEHHRPQTAGAELGDRRARGRPDLVGDRQERGRPAVDGDVHDRAARAGERCRAGLACGWSDALPLEQARVADEHAPTVHLRDRAVAGDGGEPPVADGAGSGPAARSPDDRLRQRMLALRLDGRGQRQRLVAAEGAERGDARRRPAGPRSASRSCRRPRCPGAAICSSATALLNRMPWRAPRPVPTMTAVGVARPSASGQVMTTTVMANRSAVETPAPAGPSHAKNVTAPPASATSTSQKAARSASRCAGALLLCASWTSLTIWASAVSAPTALASRAKRSVPVDGGADEPVAGALVDRHALAGHHRLVHVALAVDDLGVHRHLCARADEEVVADDHFAGRHLDRLAAADHHGHRRRQVEQRADRLVGAAAGAHLQPVAEQDERGEEGGRLVEHLAVDPEGHGDRVRPAGADGDRDEDHHVQRAVAQRLGRAAEEDGGRVEDDRQAEQQLEDVGREAEGDRQLPAEESRAHGRPEHDGHGQHRRDDEPVAQVAGHGRHGHAAVAGVGAGRLVGARLRGRGAGGAHTCRGADSPAQWYPHSITQRRSCSGRRDRRVVADGHGLGDRVAVRSRARRVSPADRARRCGSRPRTTGRRRPGRRSPRASRPSPPIRRPTSCADAVHGEVVPEPRGTHAGRRRLLQSPTAAPARNAPAGRGNTGRRTGSDRRRPRPPRRLETP